MVESFIVIQLIFDEIFVPQDFTIRTTPGLSGPAKSCGCLFGYTGCVKKVQLKMKQFFGKINVN